MQSLEDDQKRAGDSCQSLKNAETQRRLRRGGAVSSQRGIGSATDCVDKVGRRREGATAGRKVRGPGTPDSAHGPCV